MKRAAIIAAAAALVLLCAFGQASRDAYRTAYRNWRLADPNLERDAAAGGAPLAQRAEQLAEQAKNYGVERSAFLQQSAGDAQRNLAWLESPAAEPLPDLTKAAAARVTVEMAAVKRTIETYANDPDPGIQRVSTMLERENLALAALNSAIVERQNMADAARAASAAAMIAQAKALDKHRAVIAGLNQATGDSDRETAAWAQYYRLLADAVRASAAPTSADAPATVTPDPALAVITPPLSAGPPPPSQPPPPATAPPEPVKSDATATPAIPPPPPVPRPSVVTPVPLVRYTGAWTLPQTKLQFYGPEPELVDLVVNEDSGRASGTLLARFKLPPGSTGDPVVRFEFSGEFRNTRTQVFMLQASDGAKGTLELIPGTAFNLLEFTFKIEPRPGKIGQANAVLIKK